MSETPPTLLVIEDAPDHALLVSVAARRAHPGLDVRFAANGREGIDYLAGRPPFEDPAANPKPDLIILDLMMPEVHGFEVLEWMRDRDDPLHIPVVVLTSSPNEDDERRSRDLGAIAVYRKPDGVEAMGAVVREIVEGSIGRKRIMAAHMDRAG